MSETLTEKEIREYVVRRTQELGRHVCVHAKRGGRECVAYSFPTCDGKTEIAVFFRMCNATDSVTAEYSLESIRVQGSTIVLPSDDRFELP